MSALVISDSMVEFVARKVSKEVKAADGWLKSAPVFKRLMRIQPELLGFTVVYTRSWASDESKAVAMFLTGVIFETFRLAGQSFISFSKSKLEAAMKVNFEMAWERGEAQGKFVEEYLCGDAGMLHKSALVRYTTGVLLNGHETCSNELIDTADKLMLFWILKSIIDVPDKNLDVN